MIPMMNKLKRMKLFRVWGAQDELSIEARLNHMAGVKTTMNSAVFTVFSIIVPTSYCIIIGNIPLSITLLCAVITIVCVIVRKKLSNAIDQNLPNAEKLKKYMRTSLINQMISTIIVCAPLILTTPYITINSHYHLVFGAYFSYFLFRSLLMARAIHSVTIIAPLMICGLYQYTLGFEQVQIEQIQFSVVLFFFSVMFLWRREANSIRFLRKQVLLRKHIDAARKAKVQANIANRNMTYLAFHDAQTNLYNRRALMDQLKLHEDAYEEHGTHMGLMIIDIDNFSKVNDTHGHAAGDLLLKRTATRISQIASSTDYVARLAGDKFVIIVSGDEVLTRLEDLSSQILDALSKPVTFYNRTLGSSVSIGYAVCPDHAQNGDDLLRCADLALYAAKDSGRQTARAFDESLTEKVRTLQALQSDLVLALADRSVHLQFQPQIHFSTNKVIGFEALLRWNHPTRGWIPPDLILEAATQANLGMIIFALVVDESCKLVSALDKLGHHDMVVAINISSSEINRLPVTEIIAEGLSRHRINPRQLEIEITEQVTFTEKQTQEKLVLIQSLGVRMAIDDFGIGYSSLSSLLVCKFDRLKIDRSFIKDINEDKRCSTLIQMIVSVGRGLDVSVLAEGVETEAQARKLKHLGIDDMQGYLYGKAMPAPEIASWIEGRTSKTQSKKAFTAA